MQIMFLLFNLRLRLLLSIYYALLYFIAIYYVVTLLVTLHDYISYNRAYSLCPKMSVVMVFVSDKLF